MVARREVKLWVQVCPLACLFASGLLLSGCADMDLPAPVPTRPAGTQRQIQRYSMPSAASVSTRPAEPTTFPVRWECPGEQCDGFLTTGVESSTNLVTWKREVAFPLTNYSNVWLDPYPDPAAKFYRVFKE